jgi:Tol biopolymer transport system component
VLALATGPGALAQNPIVRVSVDGNGSEDPWGGGGARLSADGRHVMFASWGTLGYSDDDNQDSDVFVHDRVTGATVRISSDPSGGPGDGFSELGGLSADGRFAAFHSNAGDLVANDLNGESDVFVRDRDPDGNGILDEGNEVTARVSVDSSGTEANSYSAYAAVSDDGQVVTFMSFASNLDSGDGNGARDIFVHELSTGVTTRISVGIGGADSDGPSDYPQISADGRYVVFGSDATNLVAGDTNGVRDVFVYDRSTATVERVSVDSSGNEGDAISSTAGALSADGHFVVFHSMASNLVSLDTNGTWDVFVRDRIAGTTARASESSSGAQGNGASYATGISADGSKVSFHSGATNLVEGDDKRYVDAFVHVLADGSTMLVSAACDGEAGNGDSLVPEISDDGSVVAFASRASNLVAADANARDDAFVRDLTVSSDATWSNYGAGHPGTSGVPGLTASADPVLGASIAIDVENSAGIDACGLLLVGLDDASLPTSAGGTILVDWRVAAPVLVPAAGASFPGDVPGDLDLCGLSIYLQALELDFGASHRISFTPGLQLVLGG